MARIDDLKNELEVNEKILRTLEKQGTTEAKINKERKKALEELIKDQKEYRNLLEEGYKEDSKEVQKITKRIERLAKEFDRATNEASEFNRVIESSDPAQLYTAFKTSLSDVADEFTKTGEAAKDTLTHMYLMIERQSKVTFDKIYSRDLKKFEKRMKEASMMGDWEGAREAAFKISEIQKTGLGAIEKRKELEETRFKGGKGAQTGTVGKEIGQLWKTKDTAGFEKLSKAIKLMGAEAGTATSLLGGVAGALGAIVKVAGRLGLLVTGIVALVKIMNNLDKFLKDLNQSAAQMAGAITGIDNPRKFFKQFNDALFDAQRNLRLGLSADEISAYFRSLHDAGLSLQGVNKRIGNFNDAIELGRRLSLQFGEDFKTFGGFMVDQMLEMRMSIDEVGESFARMSEDASKAGIMSNKFYQAINSSIASLAFYGKFIDAASVSIRKLTESRTVGLKDAEELTTELLNLFEKMPRELRTRLMETHKELFTGLAKKEVTGAETRLAGAREKLQKFTPGSPEALAFEKNVVKPLLIEIGEWRQTAKKLEAGRTFEVIGDLPKFAKHTPIIIAAELKKLGKTFEDLFDTDVRMQLEALTGINDKSLLMIARQAKSSGDYFKDILNTLDENSDKFEENIFSISDAIKDFMKEGEQKEFGRKALTEALTKAGFTPDFIASFQSAMEDIPTFSKIFNSLKPGSDIKELVKKAKDNIQDVRNESITKLFDPEKTNRKEQAEENIKKQNEIIKEITPLQKMVGITAESVHYLFASSNLQRDIADATMKTSKFVEAIFGWLTKKNATKEQEQERLRQLAFQQSLKDAKDREERSKKENEERDKRYNELKKDLEENNREPTRYEKEFIGAYEKEKKFRGGNKLLKDIEKGSLTDLLIPSKAPGVSTAIGASRLLEILGATEANSAGSTNGFAGLRGTAEVVSDKAKAMLHKGEFVVDKNVGEYIKTMGNKNLQNPIEQKFTFHMNISSNNPKEIVDYVERYVKQSLRSQANVPV